MERRIRWGIIGTGKIAKRFAEGLRRLPEAELWAVGSRSGETAEAFGAAYGVARRYAGYEAVAADPAVDVVYVATPHVYHREHSLLALRHGKAVLCEKPFALNAREAEEVVAFARARGLFVMEAMWMRFVPVMDELSRLLAERAIGDVRLLTADFGFRADVGPGHRLLDPALGGGALLDLGVYPVSLASMLWGAPQRLGGLAQLAPTGVDEQAAVVLDYGGPMAVLYAGIAVDSPVEALLMGTGGSLRLHRRFHHASRLTLSRPGREDEVFERPVEGNGLHYQAAEVMRCLREGRPESDRMPLDETVSILRTLDALRAQWGVRYPGEEIPNPKP